MRFRLRPILISSLTMTLKHSNGLTLCVSKSVNTHITLLYLTIGFNIIFWYLKLRIHIFQVPSERFTMKLLP